MMKTKLGVLILVFLAGMILANAEPALIYAGEVGTGTIWSPFLNVSFFTGKPVTFSSGTKLGGPLTAYYEPSNTVCVKTGNYYANMFLTVRLFKSTKVISTYEWPGSYPNSQTPPPAPQEVCLGDIGDPGSGQGEVIMAFMKWVVQQIYPDAGDAYLLSIDNVGMAPDALAFVADIVIAVR